MTLFYDVEVFKHQSCVVFKNEDGETVRIFTNNWHGLGEYIDKGVLTHEGYNGLAEYLEGKTLIGYNNYHYDDYILYAMSMGLKQRHIKEWNDAIIQKKSKINMKKIEICETLDCFQQIDVSMPSLKKIEGNMGSSIHESPIDFDIERKLTTSENLEVVQYCEYDVLKTIDIYNMRDNYFSSKKEIIKMLPEEMREKAIKWNTTSIVGQLLRPSRKAPSRRLVDDEMLSLVPVEVQDMWRELDTTIDFNFKKKKVIVQEFGNVIEFGWGGLHGVPKGYLERENIRLADVASMYPNILINLNGLGDKTDYYKSILEHRLELKHQGKKEEQAPYKLILNSTYGLLNNQYSQLNHPHLAYSICIYGQISLYVLAKRLSGIGAEIININTDGVAYCYEGDEDELVKREWEEEFSLDLETEYFKKWWQSDVNNYLALTQKDYIVCKGGDVNKYHQNNYFKNNDIRIVQIALVEKIVHGKDVANTIVENLDNPLLYQYILRTSSKFKGLVYADNKDELLHNSTNRVFASKGGVEILRMRVDGGYNKFPDAPPSMYLWNDEISKLENFKDIVDLQWYYDLTMEKLKRWR